MENKYNYTTEENVFIAKRNIVDYIWKSANLEGISVTFPETEAIYNGFGVQSVKVRDIVAINNLKTAWRFVLSNIGYPIGFDFITEINRIVGRDHLIIRAGRIRNSAVRIGGTGWTPEPTLEEDRVKAEVEEIIRKGTATDRAFHLMLYIMRKQLFMDGNKRTAMLAANKILISEGAGIISVPIEDQVRFRELLISYYETGAMEDIKQFLYDRCIDGMDLSAEYDEELE